MPGFFSLEGAKQQLGVTTTIEQCLAEQEVQVEREQVPAKRWLWEKEPETRWAKVDHLLYLPVLGLTRPRDLYYYQGQGLRVLYGFTYKYLTVEHFLGRLTRLEVGQPLAAGLAQTYSQAWYPGQEPLVIYVDWHIKPHWTKQAAHSGAVTMWGRVMPGTKQLLINGPGGHLLGGWNMAIDSHLSHVLVRLEERLGTLWGRPIAYTVCDSEGGGLPLGQQYLAAERAYLSYLSRQGYALDKFKLLDDWQPLTADPDREVVRAHWRDPLKAKAEVRDLILMRRVGDTDPTRIYTGHLPPTMSRPPTGNAGPVRNGLSANWSMGPISTPTLAIPIRPDPTGPCSVTGSKPRPEWKSANGKWPVTVRRGYISSNRPLRSGKPISSNNSPWTRP